MIQTQIDGISISGIACAVPEHKRSVAEFETVFGGESVEKFRSMTGVQGFYAGCEEQTASDLAYEAAQAVLEGQERESIGALIYVTQTPDYQLPATACVLAGRLGLSKDCIAYDINLGCSGYVFGLQSIASLMKTSSINRALLLTGDMLTKKVSPQDRSACMLFGDAGSATLLEKKEGARPINGAFRTDGRGFQTIIIPAGGARMPQGSAERVRWKRDDNIRSDYDLYMNGTDVFTFTITEVPRLIRSFMQNSGLSMEQTDALVLHQANAFILRQIAKKLKCPEEKLPISMDCYGNTSVNSIPLTLCHCCADNAQGKLHAVLCGFGVGLSWGVMDVELDKAVLHPVLHTDRHFTEGSVSRD